MAGVMTREHIVDIVINRIATEPGAFVKGLTTKQVAKTPFSELHLFGMHKRSVMRDAMWLVSIAIQQHTGSEHMVLIVDEGLETYRTPSDFALDLAIKYLPNKNTGPVDLDRGEISDIVRKMLASYPKAKLPFAEIWDTTPFNVLGIKNRHKHVAFGLSIQAVLIARELLYDIKQDISVYASELKKMQTVGELIDFVCSTLHSK